MNKNLTEIIFLLDRSGSMAGLESETISGFNNFIENQNRVKAKTIITTVLFDNMYEILLNGVLSSDAKISNKDYYVRGSTALLDAVGKTIVDVGVRLSKTKESERPGKVVFVITTDGLENASKEYTYEKVKDLISHQSVKYGWEFIFLGANIDSAKEAESIGIDKNKSYNYDTTEEGTKRMYYFVDEVVSEMRKD
ncbi:VWA domain-containing protein [Herbivorax sp. ANBcel31]|uniref:vWA domain-containing protein n=1 Tax=Herbivorax sp. ANBcel31 TaxID=3069754 RepID=UPI0027AFA39C|nr:VWA domain-containing protein [Herbivorax sp. ANBcel31]MDQ2085168.1 VWA domain-containing protein [Herbivorax sp. ANBcel31]